MDSTIDGVSKSLNELVFSYAEKVDKTLQKKHVMMAMSSLVLLLVLGSFISPKGKAESSIFYPDTCLGGWVNPQYAQGEQETTSNGDESQFTKNNSAVLPKNTDAEMYCGNFKGKFDSSTRPTKIIVSLALTKGPDLLLEDTLESGLVASSSVTTTATTTDTPLILASSTASSIPEEASATSSQESTSSQVELATSTSSEATSTETATPIVSPQEPPSVLNGIIESVKDTINTLFDSKSSDTPGTTDTVVIPPPAPEPAPTPASESSPVQEPAPAPAPESAPTSYLPLLKENILSSLFQKVFAQEEGVSPTPPTDPAPTPTPQESLSPVITEPASSEGTPPSETIPTTTSNSPQDGITVGTSSEQTSTTDSATTPSSETQDTHSTTTIEENHIDTPQASSLLEALTNTISASSSDMSATSTATTADTTATTTETATATTTSTDDNQFQNNFLEVLYTFDGVTWTSLGELNEISMKYRTFEIPVTASTTWDDMSKLQVKVIAKKHSSDTPTVYLDAIKVEVLFDTTLLHSHPDFARDTILQDETAGGMRIVTIINNETNQEEIWYMYLDDATSTDTNASSTDVSATTTSQSPQASITSQLSEGTSTVDGATTTISTSTPLIKPVLPKNIWMKFNGKRKEGVSGEIFAEIIKKTDEEKNKSEEDKKKELPDFTLDVIRRIKGTFSNVVIVQLQKNNNEALWVYDIEKNTEEKIGEGTSTSIASNSPLGVKDGYIFWLSADNSTVFAYNIVTKDIKEQPVPLYDTSKGERGEVIFLDIPWKVIINGDKFSFFSEATGEVFSDDNGSVAEALRQKLKLDTVLDKESLSNLNLQVESMDDSVSR